MRRTHHLPDERVHFTWNAGNEPVLIVDSGDTVVGWTADVHTRRPGRAQGAVLTAIYAPLRTLGALRRPNVRLRRAPGA